MRLKIFTTAALCIVGILAFCTQVNGSTIPVAGVVQELGDLHEEVVQEVEMKLGDQAIKEQIEEDRKELQEEVREARLQAAIDRNEIEPEPDYTEYDIPNYSGYKSWMSWKSLTSRTSPQWRLQECAWTDDYGFRRVDDRYMVALGSYFTETIGDYFDIILENGEVIECILSDCKANKDTDSANMFTAHNGCLTEFVIDPGSLYSKVKNSGDCSSRDESWDYKVVRIKVYDKNYFDEVI